MSLAEQILSTYKTKISALELNPHADGRFEVYLGDEKIYSKHATGKFPEWAEIEPHLGPAE